MNNEEAVQTIQALVNDLRTASSADHIADLRVRLASWKAWLGERLVDAEMEFNQELNELMASKDLPANKATIKAKAGDNYRLYARYKQFYNDLQTVISAARTRLTVLEDERRNY